MSIFPKKKKWRFLLGAIIIAVIAIFATSNGSSPLNNSNFAVAKLLIYS